MIMIVQNRSIIRKALKIKNYTKVLIVTAAASSNSWKAGKKCSIFDENFLAASHGCWINEKKNHPKYQKSCWQLLSVTKQVLIPGRSEQERESERDSGILASGGEYNSISESGKLSSLKDQRGRSFRHS